MSDLIARMRRNPAADWKIQDVRRLCDELEIRCTPPTGGGSHWKVSHPSQREILTIPAARPIKVIYIRKLVRFAEAVGAGNGDGGT